MNKDISTTLNQKCSILVITILIKQLHTMSLIYFLPWQRVEFQSSPIPKASLATFSVFFFFIDTVFAYSN